MLTTNAHGLKMNEPWTMSTSRQCTLAAQGIAEISPNRPFYILVRNVSDRDARIPKHMKITQKVEFPNILDAFDTDVQEALQIGPL